MVRGHVARSEPGLDSYRGLLVLAMFVVHVARLQRSWGSAGAGEATLNAASSWALRWEPYIAAAFLWVAGASLALSRERSSGGRWWRGLLVRALGLYALATLLFVGQYGLAWPDVLTSPGILSVIALALIACAAALSGPAADASLLAVTSAALVATYLLDRAGVTVSGLDDGPGGALPLIGFAAAGALQARWHRRWAHGLGAATLAALLPSLCAARWGGAITTIHTSYYPDVGGDVAVTALLHPLRLLSGPRVATAFWNHSATGALLLMAPIAGSVWAFVSLGASASLLALLGRHALAAYVMHLGALGVLTLCGVAPASALFTWLWVAALAAVALAQAAAIEALAAQYQRVRAAG